MHFYWTALASRLWAGPRAATVPEPRERDRAADHPTGGHAEQGQGSEGLSLRGRGEGGGTTGGEGMGAEAFDRDIESGGVFFGEKAVSGRALAGNQSAQGQPLIGGEGVALGQELYKIENEHQGGRGNAEGQGGRGALMGDEGAAQQGALEGDEKGQEQQVHMGGGAVVGDEGAAQHGQQVQLFVGHTRFATSSIPSVGETHPHQWCPRMRVRLWRMGPGAQGPQLERLYSDIFVTHNGENPKP